MAKRPSPRTILSLNALDDRVMPSSTALLPLAVPVGPAPAPIHPGIATLTMQPLSPSSLLCRDSAGGTFSASIDVRPVLVFQDLRQPKGRLYDQGPNAGDQTAEKPVAKSHAETDTTNTKNKDGTTTTVKKTHTVTKYDDGTTEVEDKTEKTEGGTTTEKTKSAKYDKDGKKTDQTDEDGTTYHRDPDKGWVKTDKDGKEDPKNTKPSNADYPEKLPDKWNLK